MDYPAQAAADISIDVCSQNDFQQIGIYFYLYSGEMYDLWQSVLKSKST